MINLNKYIWENNGRNFPYQVGEIHTPKRISQSLPLANSLLEEALSLDGRASRSILSPAQDICKRFFFPERFSMKCGWQLSSWVDLNLKWNKL